MKQLDLTATVVSSFSGRITTQIVKATRPNTLICCAGYKATKITLRVRPVPPQSTGTGLTQPAYTDLTHPAQFPFRIQFLILVAFPAYLKFGPYLSDIFQALKVSIMFPMKIPPAGEVKWSAMVKRKRPPGDDVKSANVKRTPPPHDCARAYGSHRIRLRKLLVNHPTTLADESHESGKISGLTESHT